MRLVSSPLSYQGGAHAAIDLGRIHLVAVQISWGVNATDPVEIIGVIPNGNAFVLPTKSNVNGRGWDVNIAAGTTYLLTMLDSGSIGNGGSSDFLYTRQSNNTECIDAAAPSRTPGSTWGTPDGVAATTAQPEPTGGNGGGGGSLGAGGIAGAVIGGIVGFAVIQVALLWCLCRSSLLPFSLLSSSARATWLIGASSSPPPIGNRFRRTLAKSPVDLFSTKAEGQEVGAPVTSAGRRRGLFGLRSDRDVSQYQPEPYYTNASGQPSNDALVSAGSGGRRAGSGESDPFTDGRGDGSSSYLYPSGSGSGADWARRGSHSDADGGDSLGSPVSPGGIGLRPMGGSSGRSQGSTPPLSATATPNSPVGGGHAGSFLDSASASPSYATTGTNPLTSTMLTGVTSNRHLPRSGSMLSTPSTVVPPYNPTSTTPAVVRSTKQMLALANPDDDGMLPGPSFVRHRDAGPVEPPLAPRREHEPVELPPMYDEIEHRHRQQQEQEVARERAAQDADDARQRSPTGPSDDSSRPADEPRPPGGHDDDDEGAIAIGAEGSDRRPA